MFLFKPQNKNRINGILMRIQRKIYTGNHRIGNNFDHGSSTVSGYLWKNEIHIDLIVYEFLISCSGYGDL